MDARAAAIVLALSGCAPVSVDAIDVDLAQAGGDGAASSVDLAVDAAVVPARVCDPKSYGAKGDGLAKDTRAIQDAIDDCATTGGTVSLHDGTFLSGMVRLKSRVTLDIAPTATLLGSRSIADYPDVSPPFANTQLGNCKKALIYVESADQVSIRGGGTIHGNARGVPDWNGNKIKESLRPMAIFTAASKNVTVENLLVKDAATWAVVHMEVEHLVVRGLTVDTDLGPTHDGIDVVDGRDVLIEDCVVTSGDDSICLKSGSANGLRDVIVRNCHTKQSGVANGIKFGTASVGPFDNIVIEDVKVEHAQAAAMAVESVDGSVISNITFRRISVSDVGTPFFVLLGSRDRDPTKVGSIDGLRFEDITGGNLRYSWGAVITGTIVGTQTFGISNITFKNIDITFKGAGATPNPPPFTDDNFPEYQGPVPNQPGKRYNQYPDAKFICGVDGHENISYKAPGWAFFLRHASGVSFESCKTTVSGADPRPWRDTKDTSAISGTCVP
jgi:polygalacturonase